MTPGQKFGTEERDNLVGFGMAKGLSSKHLCLLDSLGDPVPLLYLHETKTLCFLLTTHSSACFTYGTPDGRVIQKPLGHIHTHPQTAPASVFQDPHLLMGSQLPGPLCPSAGPCFFPVTDVMECHPVL